MPKQLFSDAIDDYARHRRSLGRSESALRNDKNVLKRALRIIGNIYVEHTHAGHMDDYFGTASESRTAHSLNVDHSVLNNFYDWAKRTKRLGRAVSPMEGRSRPKFAPREWRGVHMSKFPAMLDSARHPRDRILIASGLYLLGRSCEYTGLRVEDLRLEASEVTYRIPKTYKVDLMPITTEWDTELRRWLPYYAQQCGPLEPHWYLIPGKSRPVVVGGAMVPGSSRLVPTKKMRATHLAVQQALEAVGFATRDPDGKSRREGTHTLRRSAARALYEQLLAEGDPRPVETVRAVLHHSTEKQTRAYIGLEAEREHRDARLKGKLMFPSLVDPKVIQLPWQGKTPEQAYMAGEEYGQDIIGWERNG